MISLVVSPEIFRAIIRCPSGARSGRSVGDRTSFSRRGVLRWFLRISSYRSYPLYDSVTASQTCVLDLFDTMGLFFSGFYFCQFGNFPRIQISQRLGQFFSCFTCFWPVLPVFRPLFRRSVCVRLDFFWKFR